ncbi:MAG: hypothetical protein KDA86_26105 [Planctomycetaceae bacterium]|nr:hypothetical protein [Planctomycetaceae bacterium]
MGRRIVSVDTYLDQPPSLVRLLVERAERLVGRGRWTDARALFYAAITADPTPAARIAFGVCLADDGHEEEAIPQLEQAWEDAKRLQMPDARAVCCHNLSNIYRRRANEVLSFQYEQLAMAAEMDSQRFQETASLSCEMLIQSAALLSQGNELDEALCLLNAALVLSDDSPCARATIEAQVGVTLAHLGKTGQALLRLVTAHRLHREANNLPECAHDLMNIGHLLQAQSRYAEALRCFQLAGEIYRRLDAKNGVEIARQFAREVERIKAIESFDYSRN